MPTDKDKLLDVLNTLAVRIGDASVHLEDAGKSLGRCAASIHDICDIIEDMGPPPVPVDPPPVNPPSSSNRPQSSLGTGCYVVGRNMYDGNGKLFTLRGTNKCHQDVQSPALGQTASNATRWIAMQEPWIPYTAQGFIARMQDAGTGGTTHNKCIQIPGCWDGTCKEDRASFDAIIKRWLPDMQLYQAQCERWMILNPANEWGGSDADWRDAYIAAIPKLRASGWHGCIMVDAPKCGQNGMAIVNQGAAILDADPERNVCFSWHIYGMVYDSYGGIPKAWNEQIDLVPTMDALRATGLCVVIGEFGPGENIGGSPTMLKPERVITLAEHSGFGWLSWSWDDNNAANSTAVEPTFSHLFDHKKSVLGANQTKYGTKIVQYWLDYAIKATVFDNGALLPGD